MKATIIAELVKQLDEKVASIEKKVKKQGGTIIYTKSEPYMVSDKESNQYGQEVVDIEVEASYQISGWEFIASLEYIDGTNLVKGAGKVENIPEKYVHSNICEHCNTNRARKNTILLRNTETGDYKQVGRSCVKDYVGIDAEHYLSYLSWFASLEDYLETLEHQIGGGYSIAYNIKDVLEQTITEVQHFGYISKSTVAENGGEKTSSVIYYILTGLTPEYNSARSYERYEITEEQEALAEQVVKFILAINEPTDYERNLQVLINAGYATRKNLGLAVSIYGYYLRQTKVAKERQEISDSEWVGEIGQRITITAKPELITSYETEYGYTYVYRFVENGNVFIWKKSGSFGEWITDPKGGTHYVSYDDVITFKATVKEHSEYGGVKQTIINRGKIIK